MVLKEEKEATCNTVSQRYELPDGASIEVAAERFCAPEIYFLPVSTHKIQINILGTYWIGRF